jgi:hypothetical protein
LHLFSWVRISWFGLSSSSMLQKFPESTKFHTFSFFHKVFKENLRLIIFQVLNAFKISMRNHHRDQTWAWTWKFLSIKHQFFWIS